MNQLSQVRSQIPESGIRKLQELASQIPDAIHLEVGEPDVNTPAHILEYAAQATREGFTKYTPVPGYPSLRTAVKEDLAETYGLDVALDEIVVTAGASLALAASLLAIADPGDEVLIPDPAWPVYEMILRAHQYTPVRYTLDPERGFLPNIDELEQKVTSKTKAIMINTPGNPTGGVFDASTIEELMKVAVKHDLYVISDEVYDSFVFEGKHVTPKAYDTDGRVISIFGVSKKYAMTGWRVGFTIANKQISSTISKILVTLIGNAPSVSQKAAEAAIKGPQECVDEMKNSYMRRRDLSYELFESAGIKAYRPLGAFYMLVDISDTGMTSDDFALTLLKEEKVAVAPGSTFGESTERMIRLSLATKEEDLLEGAKRICKFIHQYKK